MTFDKKQPQGSQPVSRLIRELNRLPGIGPKSAQRLAYHIIRLSPAESQALADVVLAVKDSIIVCSVCQNLTEMDPCFICNDDRRDRTLICVVEDPLDVLAMERTRVFRGLYHVLHGVISPMNGVGPEDLKIRELLLRLQDGLVAEVILGVNPTLEGDATVMYLQRVLDPLKTRVTNLARGLPMGGHLENADEVTISRAYQGRREL